jgi:hypothetical protein
VSSALVIDEAASKVAAMKLILAHLDDNQGAVKTGVVEILEGGATLALGVIGALLDVAADGLVAKYGPEIARSTVRVALGMAVAESERNAIAP